MSGRFNIAEKLALAWYRGSSWLILLRPLEVVFVWLVRKRHYVYLQGKKQSWRAPVPVLVVGNITVGGVGKTPLVASLAIWLKEQGFKPGIVSRGYGSDAPDYPFAVEPETHASQSGDEPLMLKRLTGCPVVIDADRVAAAKHLLSHFDCDLLLSDDGLQHYALGRDVEIAVVDGRRGLGNGWCLPAGPLREPPDRLDSVDFLVYNGECTTLDKPGYCMRVVPAGLRNLVSKKVVPADALITKDGVHAVAGIGNPERFFETLQTLGYEIRKTVFPDHYRFRKEDISFNDELPVIMTEKDAVKCTSIANKQCWCLMVEADVPQDFKDRLLAAIHSIQKTDR